MVDVDVMLLILPSVVFWCLLICVWFYGLGLLFVLLLVWCSSDFVI